MEMMQNLGVNRNAEIRFSCYQGQPDKGRLTNRTGRAIENSCVTIFANLLYIPCFQLSCERYAVVISLVARLMQ